MIAVSMRGSKMNSTDRISIPYHTTSYIAHDIDSNVSMFIQDLQDVVPYHLGRHSRGSFSLSPFTPEIQKSILDILPRSSHTSFRHSPIDEAISQSIEHIAGQILWNGQAAFELVKFSMQSDPVKDICRLYIIYGEEVIVKRTEVVQKIPKVGTDYDGKKRISIPRDKCWTIRFPDSLGGSSYYKRFISNLADYSKISPLLMIPGTSFTKTPGYNFSEYANEYALSLRRHTRKIGWTHRDRDERLFSSFHYVYRYLKFKITKALLRDHVVAELNRFLDENAKQLGIKTQIILNGIPTVEDLREQLEAWKNGQIADADQVIQ